MRKMPEARRSGLIIKLLDSETLIYDPESDKAHCLNQTAAQVFKYCDGLTTVQEACQLLSHDLQTTVDENLVWYAIEQFSKDHLLEEATQPPAFVIAGLSRRQAVKALGLAAFVAVPLVTSIVAPTPAQAATCKPPGQPCGSAVQCCSQLCPGTPAGTCA